MSFFLLLVVYKKVDCYVTSLDHVDSFPHVLTVLSSKLMVAFTEAEIGPLVTDRWEFHRNASLGGDTVAFGKFQALGVLHRLFNVSWLSVKKYIRVLPSLFKTMKHITR